jgi:hypothetical protein
MIEDVSIEAFKALQLSSSITSGAILQCLSIDYITKGN